jgi:hypothetical protein
MAAKDKRIKTKGASKKKKLVNEVTLVSEASLAQAWNSKEDEEWSELYKKEKEL